MNAGESEVFVFSPPSATEARSYLQEDPSGETGETDEAAGCDVAGF